MNKNLLLAGVIGTVVLTASQTMGAITPLTEDNPVTVTSAGFSAPGGAPIQTISSDYALAAGKGTGNVTVDVFNGVDGLVFVYKVSVATGKAITQVNISDWNFGTVAVDSSKNATATLTEGSISFSFNTVAGGTAVTAGHSVTLVAYSNLDQTQFNLVSVQGSIGNDTVVGIAPVPEASTAFFGAGAVLMMLRFGLKPMLSRKN